MKRFLLIIVCVLSVQLVSAQKVWTVQSVPNTRLEGNEIHVSDPDGFLSDSTEWFINAALDSIRNQADVFLVTLSSIGDSYPKHFATELFNYWGIGDAETNNGVLLLFVEDQHAMEFETGYGAEAVLTDARCQRIFEKKMKSYFMDGDYEGGLCAGVVEIVEVYGESVPGKLREMTETEGEETESEDLMSDFGALFVLFILFPVPIISFVRWIISLLRWLVSRKKPEELLQDAIEVKQKDGISYFETPQYSEKTSVWKRKGFLRFLLYGVSLPIIYLFAMVLVPDYMPEASLVEQDRWTTGITLFVYLSLTCGVQNLMALHRAKTQAKDSSIPGVVYKKYFKDAHSVMMRIFAPWMGWIFGMAFRKRIKKSPYCCPSCGQVMEACDAVPLSGTFALEEKIGAYRFLPYCCQSGHRFVERIRGKQYGSFINCQHCGAHAMKQVYEKTVTEADYSHEGLKEVTYVCQCCNAREVKTKSIPKLVRSSSSSSSGRSSWGGSGRSHGSFGGGRSGGGGFSGRW